MKKNSILTLLAVVAIAAAPALKAQDTALASTQGAPTWSENVGGQLAQLLASPSPEVRKQGLELALRLSGRADLDLSAVAQPLVKIYQTSEDESSRLAALSVLSEIGDEEAMQVVRRDVARQDSERIRVATLGALAQYYGTGTFYRDADVADLATDLRAQLAYAAR